MCSVFDCISEINNTYVDNTKYTDVVMSLYSLIEYSDQDEPAVNGNGDLANTTNSFNFEANITEQTDNSDTKNV